MDRPRLWTKNFSVLTLANTLYTFGFYMLLPNIPLYIAHRGGSDAQVGLVGACFTFVAIVTRLVSPLLLRKLNKKQLLRIGLLLSIVLMSSCAFTVSIGSILVVRALQGCGFGIVSTICASLAADLLPDSRRGEGISYFGMATTVMMAFSPAVGLFITEHFGYGAMFLSASAGPFVSVIVLTFLKPAEGIMRPQTKSAALPVLSNFFEPKILLQCALLVLYGICRSTEQNFLPLFAVEQGVSLSLYYIVQTWCSFVAKYITGRMFDKRGHVWSVLPGGISILCSLLITSFAHSTTVMLIGGVFSGMGLGALLPSMQAWIISRVGPEHRTVASAAFYNFYDIGITGGSIILGALAGRLGYAMTFRSAIVSIAAFLILYISNLAYNSKPPSTHRETP